MNAHIECNDGWLEPLLARIVENRGAAVTPVIDDINPYNFALQNYLDMDNMYGSFEWNMFQVW